MNIISDEVKLRQDVVADSVVSILKNRYTDDQTTLYYAYPIYRGDLPEDLIGAQLLLASKKYGVVYFMCITESRKLNDVEKVEFDELDAHLFDRFNKYQNLHSSRRELKFPIRGIVVCPFDDEVDGIVYAKNESLLQKIESETTDLLSDEDFKFVLACIEGTQKMTQKKVRETKQFADGSISKGNVLNIIQNKLTAFDLEQKKTALVTIDGPQRIRGLAGSGKTIILTMKAALYHLAHPDEEILYTFYTKSLYGMIRSLIERFYRDNADNREPNWNKIHILHAWGGYDLQGVYSSTCMRYQMPSITYGEARLRGRNPLGYVCSQLMKSVHVTPAYNLVLIDEGQDFPNEFYQLCYALARDHRIVWAYDDFQDIFDVNIQDEKHLFGTTEDGNPVVDFEKEKDRCNQDIVLHTCYRTPRYILTAAFALGMGIYNSKVLQRLESNRHWESLGFRILHGDCEKTGDSMVIERPLDYTPNDMNTAFKMSSIKVNEFLDFESECHAVCDCICRNITEENLLPEDICVIALDERNIRKYYEVLTNMLRQKGVRTFNILEAPNSNVNFKREGRVTLGTINRAKGNEAGMVYLMGLDAVFINPNSIHERNKLFTAMTRAKGWVMMTGTGDGSLHQLKYELSELTKNNYLLCFVQPSKEDTKTLMEGSLTQQEQFSTIQKALEKLKLQGYTQEQILDIITHAKK